MNSRFYRTNFRFIAERYEEWQSGHCISEGSISTEILAEVRGDIIHFELSNIGDIRILKSFDFEILGDSYCILRDRIQYSHSTYDFNPIVPIVCHIFYTGTHMNYVRFAMTNPDRLVEFYGELAECGQFAMVKHSKSISDIARQSIGITETEEFVNEALEQLAAGKDGDETYHPLYKAWRSYQNNPNQLKHIHDFGRYGMGLMIFLTYETVFDIDARQQIASIAYLFISKEIKQNSSSVNLYKNRLVLMILNHEAFEYTVSSVVNRNNNLFMMNLMPFKARDAMSKMEFADLSSNKALLNIDMLRDRFQDLQSKIQSDFFGKNESSFSIISLGQSLHEQVLDFLEEKVLKNGDIEF